MRTTYRLALALALVGAVLGGCSPAAPADPSGPATAPTAVTTPPTPKPAAAFPVTLVDDGGTEVTLEAEPQRIVSLVPSHTEILFALGLGDRVVGVTTFCDYPEEAKTKEQVGQFATIDLERVMALDPDLVLATSLHYQTAAPALRERGLKVILLEATSIEATLEEILTIGRATGRSPEAQALVQDIQAHLDAVATRLAQVDPKPRVFWELGPDLYSAGKDSFIDGLITAAGGDNIGRQLPGEWPQFNLEALVQADPEVIVLADQGFGESAETVRARPGWSGIAAVREGRIVEVEDVNIVSRPGPRVAEAVEYIAKALYPDLFE